MIRSIPMSRLAVAACALTFASAMAPTPAGAQPAGKEGHAPAGHPPPGNAPRTPAPKERQPRNPGWHGDIRHFPDHDWHVWRGGRWVHGPHGGRPGWWWVVGPTWYFYPVPIYPYPNPYEPAPPWAVPLPVPSAPPAQFWYFCDESQAYYPYVSTCSGGWKQVPATQGPAASEPSR